MRATICSSTATSAALLAISLMLHLNGFALTTGQPEFYQAMLALADVSMTEAMLAEWIRRNSSPA